MRRYSWKSAMVVCRTIRASELPMGQHLQFRACVLPRPAHQRAGYHHTAPFLQSGGGLRTAVRTREDPYRSVVSLDGIRREIEQTHSVKETLVEKKRAKWNRIGSQNLLPSSPPQHP